jgi:hypothetical protein
MGRRGQWVQTCPPTHRLCPSVTVLEGVGAGLSGDRAASATWP